MLRFEQNPQMWKCGPGGTVDMKELSVCSTTYNLYVDFQPYGGPTPLIHMFSRVNCILGS